MSADSVHGRRITPLNRKALKVLRHAIEHVTMECTQEGANLSQYDGSIDAALLLMRAHREIYLSCPEVPTWRERFQSIFGAHSSQAH